MKSQTARRLNPMRYIILLSVTVKVACLALLAAYWTLLPGPGWFRWVAATLLIVFIGVQGRLLWRQWR
jgi:hypothetical protein